MKIQRARRDPTADPNGPADLHHRRQPLVGRLADLRPRQGVRRRDPHGRRRQAQDRRAGATAEGVEAHIDLAGVGGNFWVGLALLHTLFMREHNAICDRLHERHPELRRRAALPEGAPRQRGADGEDPHGRLDAGASSPTRRPCSACARTGGASQASRLDKKFGRLTSNEVISGIPGSPTDHHGVPYALTEEFVAVYRMHPLIPDDFTFRSLADDRELASADAPATSARSRCASG